MNALSKALDDSNGYLSHPNAMAMMNIEVHVSFVVASNPRLKGGLERRVDDKRHIFFRRILPIVIYKEDGPTMYVV